MIGAWGNFLGLKSHPVSIPLILYCFFGSYCLIVVIALFATGYVQTGYPGWYRSLVTLMEFPANVLPVDFPKRHWVENAAFVLKLALVAFVMERLFRGMAVVAFRLFR